MSVAQDAPGVVLGLARLFLFHHTGDGLVSKLDAGDGKAVHELLLDAFGAAHQPEDGS